MMAEVFARRLPKGWVYAEIALPHDTDIHSVIIGGEGIELWDQLADTIFARAATAGIIPDHILLDHSVGLFTPDDLAALPSIVIPESGLESNFPEPGGFQQRRLAAHDLITDTYPVHPSNIIYLGTDGSVHGPRASHRFSTWGLVAAKPDGSLITTRYGRCAAQDNNVAEVTAVLQGLILAEELHRSALIVTDSVVTVSCVTNGNPLTSDSGIALQAHRLLVATDSRLEWVPGHSGYLYNDAADRIAGVARRNPSPEVAREVIDRITGEFASNLASSPTTDPREARVPEIEQVPS